VADDGGGSADLLFHAGLFACRFAGIDAEGMSAAASGNLFDLSGKVALLTGATRGIGRAMAEAMAVHGAAVVISSEVPEECAKVAAEFRTAGYRAAGIACDVSSRTQLQQLVTQTTQQLGRIDILACNAGVAPHAGPIASATDADWDLTMTVNLRSVLWLTSLVIPGMAERGGGAVIITASLSSLRGNKGIGLYGLSKAGCAQLARNLAVEWGPQNVRVNAISPGVIATEFARPLTDNPEVLARRLSLTPLRRVGTPAEVAGLAVLLASPAGAFMTGQNLVVDGGTLIGDGN
jgi:NAD(P)-dependent dehydrogenase (short-subunit alcohol dehydrogenase family)